MTGKAGDVMEFSFIVKEIDACGSWTWLRCRNVWVAPFTLWVTHVHPMPGEKSPPERGHFGILGNLVNFFNVEMTFMFKLFYNIHVFSGTNVVTTIHWEHECLLLTASHKTKCTPLLKLLCIYNQRTRLPL